VKRRLVKRKERPEEERAGRMMAGGPDVVRGREMHREGWERIVPWSNRNRRSDQRPRSIDRLVRAVMRSSRLLDPAL
jgi:hypothetical protein